MPKTERKAILRQVRVEGVNMPSLARVWHQVDERLGELEAAYNAHIVLGSASFPSGEALRYLTISGTHAQPVMVLDECDIRPTRIAEPRYEWRVCSYCGQGDNTGRCDCGFCGGRMPEAVIAGTTPRPVPDRYHYEGGVKQEMAQVRMDSAIWDALRVVESDEPTPQFPGLAFMLLMVMAVVLMGRLLLLVIFP